MLIGFAADPHTNKTLGHRVDAAGVNLRSRDMEAALRRVVDGMIAMRCDAAVIAGDIFDTPRPPEWTRQFVIHEIRRLRDAMPVIVLEGNHDLTGSVADKTALGTIALALPGVEVVAGYAPRTIRIGDTAFACVPWMRSDAEFLRTVDELAPDPTAATNILVLHAGMADLPEYAELRPGSQTLTRSLVPADRFDLIASGHFHGHRVIADLRWVFIGSPERLSIGDTDPKGFVTFETGQRSAGDVAAVAGRRRSRRARVAGGATTIPGLAFHPIVTRPWYDLTLDVAGWDGTRIVAEVAAAAAGIPDFGQALVRLRLRHVAPDVAVTLDRAALRTITARAFYCDDTDMSIDDPVLGELPDGDPDAVARFEDVPGEWTRFARSLERSPDEVERVVRLGLEALGVVAEEAPSSASVAA